MLWNLMQGIYEQEKIPTEWRDSAIIGPTYLYRPTGLRKLPWGKADVTYYEDLGKDH